MGTQLIRWDGMISMVTGGLLVVWWILVATLFPTLDPTVGMVDIVGESTWLPFSVPGAVAAILLPGVIVSLYMAQKGMVSKAGQVGFYLSLVGVGHVRLGADRTDLRLAEDRGRSAKPR